jgi:hypothetical protein
MLPDPQQALAVVQGIARSISEFIEVKARG